MTLLKMNDDKFQDNDFTPNDYFISQNIENEKKENIFSEILARCVFFEFEKIANEEILLDFLNKNDEKNGVHWKQKIILGKSPNINILK